mgnify:CR=1 FL=1
MALSDLFSRRRKNDPEADSSAPDAPSHPTKALARFLASLGFPALATTSAGFAWSMGMADNRVPLDEVLAHLSPASKTTLVHKNGSVMRRRLVPAALLLPLALLLSDIQDTFRVTESTLGVARGLIEVGAVAGDLQLVADDLCRHRRRGRGRRDKRRSSEHDHRTCHPEGSCATRGIAEAKRHSRDPSVAQAPSG